MQINLIHYQQHFFSQRSQRIAKYSHDSKLSGKNDTASILFKQKHFGITRFTQT